MKQGPPSPDLHLDSEEKGERPGLENTVEENVSSRQQAEEVLQERTLELLNRNAQLEVEIGERKRAAALLSENEGRYRALVEDQTEVITRHKPDGTFIFVNKTFCRYFGETPDRLLGKIWTSALVPDDLAMIQERLGTLSPASPVVTLEHRVIAGSGEIRWLQVVNSGFFDEQGRLTEYQAVGRDITERKQAEEAQKAAVELLRLCNGAESMLELMRDLTLFFQQFTGCEAVGVRLREEEDFPYYETRGFPHEFVLAENSLCGTGKYSGAERGATEGAVLECLCGTVLSGRIDDWHPGCTPHGSLWTNNSTEWHELIKTMACQAQMRYRCIEEGYQSIALIPLRTQSETFGLFQFNDRQTERFSAEKIASLESMVSYVAIALAKLKADEELQESSRALQHVQDIGRIGSYVYEMARGRWTSSAILDGILGIGADFDRSEANWLELVHPAQRVEMLSCLRDSIEKRQRFDKEYRIVRVVDGAECWVHGMGEVEYDADGTPVRMVGTLQDITGRKRTEEKIYRYARRLIEMEEDLRKRIAMELHDDIGQVLTALGLNLALIGNHLNEEPGNDLRSRLEDSRGLVKEISRTVRNLMTELRPSQLDEYGVAAAIRSHADQYAQRTGIEVVVQVDPQFPRLAAKKEIALFRIAQEALNNITKHAAATKVSVCLGSDGGLVRLAITDDGWGFVPQAASPLPASSGWGLTIMRERTELMGGVFRVDSALGQGTTISIEIRGED